MTRRALALAGARAYAQRRAIDFLALTKPRVVLMVLVTTVVGFHVGSLGPSDPLRSLHALVGTWLAAAGASALNQYLERHVDGRMERTRHRPLPDKRLQPREAGWFGLELTVAGPLYLGLAVNWLSAAVVTVTAASYLLAYTPLKRRTSLCTVLGAIPGALPPVTGWVAARGEFGVGACIQFSESSSSGSYRTPWPSPASIVRTTLAPTSGCCRSSIRTGGAPGGKWWSTVWRCLPWGCCPHSSAWPGRSISWAPWSWESSCLRVDWGSP